MLAPIRSYIRPVCLLALLCLLAAALPTAGSCMSGSDNNAKLVKMRQKRRDAYL